jgi:hypothetical protein
MKILSWDVGIYNLSYCILEKNENNIKILDWDIVNLVDNEEMKKNRGLVFENIPRKLHEKPQLLDVDIVVIENQPSLKNPQMKSIQMILYSYFLILGKIIGNGEASNTYIDKIDFCSASNKLKIYDGPEIIFEEKVKKEPKKKVSKKNKSEEIILPENINLSLENNPIVEPEKQLEIVDIVEIIEKKKKGNTMKYADKKKLAIEHAKYFVAKYESDSKYLEFFNKHKKKDDLADSFLQGLYYFKNKC